MTDVKKAGRTSAPTAPSEPSWVEPRSGTEAELLELAENVRQAELRGDVPFLDRALTTDFVGIGPRGFVLNKEAWLGRHRLGDLKYESIERDEMALRTYTDAAILTIR
ncbi:MAG TPA: nuclear transport factor 2 family protein, partial [Thermoplasmata archaeon]|nr:nuclear transport factor 2 family protein [Thermoplasmata archaeon]